MKRVGYYEFLAYMLEVACYLVRILIAMLIQLFAIILVVVYAILDPLTKSLRWLVHLIGRSIDYLLKFSKELTHRDNER